MKKIILSIAAICIVALGHAAQLTVSNSPLNPGQFTSINAAKTAANAGDTLLIQASPTSYGNISTDKQLTYIGIGFNPQKDVALNTIVGIIFTQASGVGSRFLGLNIGGIASCGSNQVIDNFLFEDCSMGNMDGGCQYNVSINTTYRNCIFTQGGINLTFNNSLVANGNIIENCIFNGSLAYNRGNLIVTHCVFLTPSGSTNQLDDIQNATFSDCIFMNNNNFPSITNNTFLNCVSFNNSITLPLAGNTGANNLNATNPQFTNVPISTGFNFGMDFHLNVASPGHNTGSDGTDRGLYGGTANFSLRGEPLSVPIIRSFTITNPTTGVNGTLLINVTATRPNNN